MTTEYQVSPIEWIRVRFKLTKRQMAGILGITEQSYGRLEKGAFKVGIDHMKTLSEHFGVSLDIFSTDTHPDTWSKFLTGNVHTVSEPWEPYGQADSSPKPHMQLNSSTEDDIFLANLTIERLKKELELKEAAFEAVKARYLETARENETLKQALKKNSPS